MDLPRVNPMTIATPLTQLSLPQLFYGPGSFAQWATTRAPELLLHHNQLRGQNKVPGMVLVHGSGGLARYPGVEDWAENLEAQGWEVFTREIASEPVDTLLDHWLLELRGRVHRVVGIGGGSVMDSAKVMAALLPVEGSTRSYLEGVGVKPAPPSRLPLDLMPTTGGTGSEATSNGVVSGITPTGDTFKKSLRHPCYVPDSAVLDPLFMVGVPAQVTAASGMDGLSQLLESHFSTKATPITRIWTRWGLEQVAQGLERAVSHGSDTQARLAMALGAFASGIGLSNAGLGLVHGIVGTLGSITEVPHGLGCARLLGPCFSRIFRAMEQAHHPDLPEVYRVAQLFLDSSNQPRANQNPQNSAVIPNPPSLMDQWIEYLQTLAQRLQLPTIAEYGYTHDMIPYLIEKAQFRTSPILLGKEELKAIFSEI